MPERVVVGMSGGVDSSLAAALLVEDGLDVVGVTMRVQAWTTPEDATARFGSCCSTSDIEDARRVARALGIRHYVLDMAAEFDRAVVAPFAAAYGAGRTPVPCLACNTDLKFGTLLRRARAWDSVAVATGHYARVTRDEASGRHLLWRGADRRKDQSDFLWPLRQAQLAAARFPLGGMTKEEVRARAAALGLPTAGKPESQELCFVTADYRDVLRARDPRGFRPGPIVDTAGTVVGAHAGLASYTVGQRRGLGLSTSRPRYVLDLDAATNTVVVGERGDLERTRLVATAVNFIALDPPSGALRVAARIRHAHEPVPATLQVRDDGRVEVAFDAPQRALTPGQSVVWYRDDLVVGGGVIERGGR